MSAIPLHDLDEVATKVDLHVLATELRSEMATLRAELQTEMGTLRAEMATEIKTFDTDDSWSVVSDTQTDRKPRQQVGQPG